MRQRRGLEDIRSLCSGPGKVCQALGITGADSGSLLGVPPFGVIPLPAAGPFHAGRRIGISKAVDLPWRFGLRNSSFLSRRFGEGE